MQLSVILHIQSHSLLPFQATRMDPSKYSTSAAPNVSVMLYHMLAPPPPPPTVVWPSNLWTYPTILEFLLRPTIMPRYSLGSPQWQHRPRRQHVVALCPRYTFAPILQERTCFVHASHPIVGHWLLLDRMERLEHSTHRRGDKLVRWKDMVGGYVMRHSQLTLAIS
jgi:hypothetical protein